MRGAGPDDATALAALQSACAARDGRIEAWSAAEWQQLLDDPGAAALLAGLPGEEAAGFALIRVVLDEAELFAIGVSPERRRHGIAEALLNAVLHRVTAAGARAFFLEVACSNTAALALYRKSGFEVVGRRPDYYGLGDCLEDALVMQWRPTADMLGEL